MLRKYLVEITILLVGAFTMMFEIVGSRIIGPYLGTSVYVWTSNIGVIFASLSLGYWLGGRLSVNRANYLYLGGMLVLALLTTEKLAVERVSSARAWLEIAQRLVAATPTYRLYSRPTAEVWPFLDRELGL